MDTTEIIAAPAAKGGKRRRTAVIAGIGAVAIAAGAVGIGLVGSGAWFSSTKSVTGNTITAGALQVGDFGAGGTVTATAVQPMTVAQATDPANEYVASVVELDVTNAGDIAFDWQVSLSNATIAPDADLLPVPTLSLADVSVAWETEPGVWSTASLEDFLANEVFEDTNLVPGATAPVSFRVFFNETAGNDYQGAVVSFDVDALATQTIEVP